MRKTTTSWGLALSLPLLLLGCGGNNNDDDGNGTAATAECQAITDTGSVVVGSGLPGDPAAPEPASGYRTGKKVVTARTYMVVTANPLASKAGCDILRAGGNAVDAAVTVQAVLGLVEPQSSGLGGGAFMLHYNAASKAVQAYDGRETAPAAATENHLRWIDDVSNQTSPRPSARASGRSIGTPGAVRMLDLAYKDHGKLPWRDLFQPAIALATNGFPISGRMASAIEGSRTSLLADAEAASTYFNADQTSKTLGTVLTIPAYAATLTAIANNGADAFYTGPIAQAIVDKINITAHAQTGAAITPGKTTMADLANYQAKKREPVCTTYRAYWVCGMSPPSSGGLAVAQTLGILENFNLNLFPPTALDIEGGKPQVQAVHLVSEAERLAYADRNKYVADTDFVPLPGGSYEAMTNKPYLRSRADLISFSTSMGTAQPGNLGPVTMGVSAATTGAGTTHFTIVDKAGNVVSMTTTVESGFGSFHMTQGFILNNQLTDFDATPTDAQGNLIANRVAPLKRPRSSMAPTLVFKMNADGSRGDFHMGTGSPGGATIIQYVVKTLVGALDWGLDAQQATSMVDFGAANSPTTSVGGEHPNVDETQPTGGLAGANDPLVAGLRALGHTVSVASQSSGISTIIRMQANGSPALQGGADPRREGLVLGDAIVP
ncbi:MAG TPA: gamma-glutamyltransferase [Caldimonas sp.]|jgi:gamma-glutamyltranspeptidase/glutathione hydrolase|nr:gamma-glutamyltransferase [Caldimonas sp.]HEX2542997.1 gamma-glutamyltransferase [Caldimonas sp.]